MPEGKEPNESNHEIPLTTFEELRQALSSGKDVIVRFIIPKETWMKSLELKKQNQDPPDEIARTGEGLLENAQVQNKITIGSRKAAYISQQPGMFHLIFPPGFGEGDDEKIKKWKIIRIKT